MNHEPHERHESETRAPAPLLGNGVAAGGMRGGAANADAATPHPGPLPSSDEGRGSQSASCASPLRRRPQPLTPALSPPPRKGEGVEARRGFPAITPAVLPKWYPAWTRLVVLAWLACLACFPLAAAEPVVAKEYQIKAAFLFHFTKFVEWPAEKFAETNSPIVIGVLGRNPFGTALAETVKDRKVNGRAIQVRQVNSVAEVKGLHVVFISGAEPNRFEVHEAVLKESAVLGVGESETFLTRGGTIRFALEEDRVCFEVDLNSAERAQLKLSAQLLKLARAVTRKP